MKDRSSTIRPKASSNTNGKGKGKATQWDSDDDDDAYVTSNDYARTPERKGKGTNGAFGEAARDDDEELYR